MRIPNIVRKYTLHIHLGDYDIKMSVYEDRTKEIHVLHEANKIIGYDKDTVYHEFMKLVIRTQRDIEIDKEETIIIKGINYELFQLLYREAIEVFPEEIFKLHDSKPVKLM